jgi:ERF superfamily
MADIEDEVTAAEALFAQEIAVRPEATHMPDIPMVDPVLAQAAAIARLPGLSESMFDRLMEWNEKEKAAQAEERFNDAMNAAQAEIAPVARTAENKQTNSFYAKLEAVDAAIRPVYLRHGFNVSFNTIPPLKEGNIRVECAISLGRFTKRYHRESAPDTLGPKGTPTKTLLHGGNSTETTLKRYAVCGAFNVQFRGVDDDGNSGGATYLTPEQVEAIRTIVDETETDPGAFFSTMLTEEVTIFEDIPAIHFDRLMNALHINKRAAPPILGMRSGLG